MPSNVAAVVLAAGKGTRMKSDRAKVLHTVAWRPMVGHVLDTLARLSPSRTLVVVGHDGAAVREALSGWRVETVEQKEQRGTGHAVQVALGSLGAFRGTVLVLPGDVPLVRTET